MFSKVFRGNRSCKCLCLRSLSVWEGSMWSGCFYFCFSVSKYETIKMSGDQSQTCCVTSSHQYIPSPISRKTRVLMWAWREWAVVGKCVSWWAWLILETPSPMFRNWLFPRSMGVEAPTWILLVAVLVSGSKHMTWSAALGCVPYLLQVCGPLLIPLVASMCSPWQSDNTAVCHEDKRYRVHKVLGALLNVCLSSLPLMGSASADLAWVPLLHTTDGPFFPFMRSKNNYSLVFQNVWQIGHGNILPAEPPNGCLSACSILLFHPVSSFAYSLLWKQQVRWNHLWYNWLLPHPRLDFLYTGRAGSLSLWLCMCHVCVHACA